MRDPCTDPADARDKLQIGPGKYYFQLDARPDK